MFNGQKNNGLHRRQKWKSFDFKSVKFFVAGYETNDTHEISKIIESLETKKHKLAEESNKLIHSIIQTDCLNQKVL